MTTTSTEAEPSACLRVTIADYLMDRQMLYSCPEETKANAAVTVERVNELLHHLHQEGIPLEVNPKTLSIVSSGWRPPEMNMRIKNAAPKSKHITGQACDLYDPEGLIDSYLMDNPATLMRIGLWMEHPSATKLWCHVQTVPPKSNKRIFFP